MAKKNTQPAVAKPDPQKMQLYVEPGESQADVLGRELSSPVVNAACTMQSFQGNVLGDASLMTNMEEICRITERVKSGDLSDIEGMLVGQAVALQTMFTSLARRAQSQTYQRHLEAFMGLALRAQAGSRATLSALVDLKFPRTTVIATQANVASGHQQVNNGGISTSTRPQSGGRTSERAESTLLEVEHGEPRGWLDTRTASKAKRSDSAMETVGEVHRTQDRRRKGKDGT